MTALGTTDPKDALRCVILDQYGSLGGGQVTLLDTIEAILGSGAEVEVVAPLDGELDVALRRRFGHSVELAHVPEIRSHGRWPLSLSVAAWTLRHIPLIRHLRNADLVVVNGPRLFPLAALAAAGRPPRYVYAVHLDHRPAEKRLIAWLADRPSTRMILLHSTFVLDRLVSSHPLLRGHPRVRVVENGLGEPFRSQSFEPRFIPGEASWNVVIVGRLAPEKGQDIVGPLASRFPHHRFHLVGARDFAGSEYAERLRRESPRNVTFVGKSLDVPGTLRQLRAHVALVPSVWEEPFGRVAIEGMACSCLTVVAHRGGLADIAARTGAITFRDLEDLVGILERLGGLPAEQLVETTREQHQRTMAAYGGTAFEEGVLAALGLTRSRQPR